MVWICVENRGILVTAEQHLHSIKALPVSHNISPARGLGGNIARHLSLRDSKEFPCHMLSRYRKLGEVEGRGIVQGGGVCPQKSPLHRMELCFARNG